MRDSVRPYEIHILPAAVNQKIELNESWLTGFSDKLRRMLPESNLTDDLLPIGLQIMLLIDAVRVHSIR